MQQVGHAAHLLNGAIYNLAGFAHCFLLLRSIGWLDKTIQNDFGGGEFLADSIVQIAGKSAPLFVLGSHQSAGKAAQFAIQGFQLRSPGDATRQTR